MRCSAIIVSVSLPRGSTPRYRGRIRRQEVRPANGNGPSRAVGALHRHPVFAPERFGHHEREAGAPEWMERMGDANLRCFSSTLCRLEL